MLSIELAQRAEPLATLSCAEDVRRSPLGELTLAGVAAAAADRLKRAPWPLRDCDACGELPYSSRVHDRAPVVSAAAAP